jgi:hypothetical protein
VILNFAAQGPTARHLRHKSAKKLCEPSIYRAFTIARFALRIYCFATKLNALLRFRQFFCVFYFR